MVIAACALAALGYWVKSQLDAPLLVQDSTRLDVPRGTSLRHLLTTLESNGYLGDSSQADSKILATRLYNRVTGISARLSAGEYPLYPEDTLLTLLARLESGQVMLRSVRLQEGWTFREFRQALAKAERLSQQIPALSDADVMAALGRAGRAPEGWFAPDTWYYSSSESDLDILRRALLRQESLLAAAWQQRQPNLPLSNEYEALILASIIERETGVAWERPLIAGVFVNRLHKKMRLQTDPTVIYGMGERYQGRITRRDLREATPWNTYVIPGLPPTPIAMPSAAAIQAAVNPETTDAIFFVAKGDGSHQFSVTLKQHEAAVKKYQLQRRSDYRSFPTPVSP